MAADFRGRKLKPGKFVDKKKPTVAGAKSHRSRGGTTGGDGTKKGKMKSIPMPPGRGPGPSKVPPGKPLPPGRPMPPGRGPGPSRVPPGKPPGPMPAPRPFPGKDGGPQRDPGKGRGTKPPVIKPTGQHPINPGHPMPPTRVAPATPGSRKARY